MESADHFRFCAPDAILVQQLRARCSFRVWANLYLFLLWQVLTVTQ